MYTLEIFYKEGDRLTQQFNAFIEENNLHAQTLPDHICFKCGNTELFEQLRALLETEAKFVHQAIISGRRIAMIKLSRGFQTCLGEITVLELSDQKPSNSQVTGFDHIEIYPQESSFDDFVQMIELTGAQMNKVERPHHTTYDIPLGEKYNVKLTREPIFEKIKREEMV